MELLSGCVNFWLLLRKLLKELLNWIYSGLCGSLGKERMAVGEVEAIYQLKYFIFCRQKTHGKWQEHRENTGNLVLIGAWQPWRTENVLLCTLCDNYIIVTFAILGYSHLVEVVQMSRSCKIRNQVCVLFVPMLLRTLLVVLGNFIFFCKEYSKSKF